MVYGCSSRAVAILISHCMIYMRKEHIVVMHRPERHRDVAASSLTSYLSTVGCGTRFEAEDAGYVELEGDEWRKKLQT